jgi:hypothetical protein
MQHAESDLWKLGREVDSFYDEHRWRERFDAGLTSAMAGLFERLGERYWDPNLSPVARPIVRAWHAVLLPLAHRTLDRSVKLVSDLVPEAGLLVWVEAERRNLLGPPYFQRHPVTGFDPPVLDGRPLMLYLGELVEAWITASLQIANAQGSSSAIAGAARGYRCREMDSLPPEALSLPLAPQIGPTGSELALLAEMAAMAGFATTEVDLAVRPESSRTGCRRLRLLCPSRTLSRKGVCERLAEEGVARLRVAASVDAGTAGRELDQHEQALILDRCRVSVAAIPDRLSEFAWAL